MTSSSVRCGKIDACFITHLHGDHFYGLPGLGMRLLGIRSAGEKTRLFAPYGLRTFLGTSVTASRSFDVREIIPSSSRRAAELALNGLNIDPQTGAYRLVENEYFSVKAVPIKHSVFCLGYVIEEKPQRGHINAERLTREYNMPPGPIYRDILAGKTVSAPDGRVIDASLVVSQPRPSRKIVVLGDTCDPSNIAPHAMDADVLVHEATCTDEDLPLAISKGHSTAGMAGAFARGIRAKRLILNHFSPRGYMPNEYEESKSIRILVQQARAAFGSELVYAAKVNGLLPGH